ncbi:unnamed protein product [Cyclocybe aegerita]|uniref:Uncharacterized protein n=1 Tax=Cyclocybe aegerita TaxID=1973307 RepID=A0A8S0XLP7_CYCAE|nr:unnamed protein product [Cyclocybe aegerita]
MVAFLDRVSVEPECRVSIRCTKSKAHLSNVRRMLYEQSLTRYAAGAASKAKSLSLSLFNAGFALQIPYSSSQHSALLLDALVSFHSNTELTEAFRPINSFSHRTEFAHLTILRFEYDGSLSPPTRLEERFLYSLVNIETLYTTPHTLDQVMKLPGTLDGTYQHTPFPKLQTIFSHEGSATLLEADPAAFFKRRVQEGRPIRTLHVPRNGPHYGWHLEDVDGLTVVFMESNFENPTASVLSSTSFPTCQSLDYISLMAQTTLSSDGGPAVTLAKLLYFTEPEGAARAYHFINSDPATGQRKKNWEFDERQVSIENLRGKEDTVSLDTTGFQFAKHTTAHTSFANDEEIKREYYPESIELIKKSTGATRVELFDHTVRRHHPGDTEDIPSKRRPVAQVHVDQTTASAIARVHRHLPSEDVPKLLNSRFQLINLWRPIGKPAFDWPLALCDYRSVDPVKDVTPIALIYPDREEGETMGVKYGDQHKWKYLYGMKPDEVVLIKCFDSIQDGSVARFTPHTAFSDPNTPPGAPLRESIELRSLVFYD